MDNIRTKKEEVQKEVVEKVEKQEPMFDFKLPEFQEPAGWEEQKAWDQ